MLTNGACSFTHLLRTEIHGNLGLARAAASINIVIDIFLLKVLGWCTPDISGGPTSTPPPCITCGTVQLFFDFLLRLIIFVHARFASCFLTFSAASSKYVFCQHD